MPRRSPTKVARVSQADKFAELARALGPEMSERQFKKALGKIATGKAKGGKSSAK